MMRKFKLYLAGNEPLESDKTLLMGILNATPDSFSDGGRLDNPQTLKNQIEQMIRSGADILDVGGESTRPGFQKVEASEELRRILPVIEAIRQISKDVPISIDTQKAAVAEAALAAGASFINDVSALNDPDMAKVINKYGCSIILMRNRPTGKDPVKGCKKQFEEILTYAQKQGLEKDRVLLDPGLGFGDLKSGDYSLSPGSDPAANIRLILKINDYSLGLPVVIGASRKRFLGDLTGVEKASERLAGSIAAAVMAAQAGASIIRVHDVAETTQVLKKIRPWL